MPIVIFKGTSYEQGRQCLHSSIVADEQRQCLLTAMSLENRQRFPYAMYSSDSRQKIVTSLFLQGTQAVLYSADSAAARQLIHAGHVLTSAQAIAYSMQELLQGRQRLPYIMSPPPFSGRQLFLLDMSKKDIIQSRQLLLQALGELPPIIITPDGKPTVPPGYPDPLPEDTEYKANWNIYIDGQSVRNRITEFSLTMSQEQEHNTVSLSSMDRELFFSSEPWQKTATARIEVQIGSRFWKFLLEKRSGNTPKFQIWGRSPSALLDVPYAQPISFSPGISDASDCAEEILRDAALDWEIPTWMLPYDYEVSGVTPWEAAGQLAAVAGGIIRSNPDGSVKIRKVWPVRPVHMQIAVPAIYLDRYENIISPSFAEEPGNWYNQIEVIGYGSQDESPKIIVEDSLRDDGVRVIGDDVFVRVYWPYEDIYAPAVTFCTDGTAEFLGVTVTSEEERVDFQNYVGTVSLPIIALNSVEWFPSVNGEWPSYEPFGNELKASVKYGIATITYSSSYQRFRLKGHHALRILAVFNSYTTSAVAAIIKTADAVGDNIRAANSISDNLITDQATAVARGTAFLDNNKYNKHRVSLRTPYTDSLEDGIIAQVNDATLNCKGNYLIESVEIKGKGPQIICNLGLVKCLV